MLNAVSDGASKSFKMVEEGEDNMKDCGTCKGFPGCDNPDCFREINRAAKRAEAVIDTARNYIAVVKTIDIDSPDELIAIAQRRRGELVKAVDRLEGNKNG